MKSSRFTVVCGFAGGTYVSQFMASDSIDVAHKWAEMLVSEKPIPRASGYIARSVLHDFDIELTPTPLEGLTNVWQIGGAIGTNDYRATIIQTS